MIIVTGGAGFIGSNLVKALNQRGVDDILVVDDMTDSGKSRNLADLTIHDYMDKADFLEAIQRNHSFGKVSAVLHEGACSDTMQSDEKYMMENNFTYSKELYYFCERNNSQYIYASSASVYGSGDVFIEDPKNEAALNVYAESKLLFDQFVRQQNPKFQCVGLRYFNVYGPREQHKEKMASVAWHFFNQFRKDGIVRLFQGTDGYEHGEQRRDFISVEDVVKVNFFFMDNPNISGIYNVGTGHSHSFNEVAISVINEYWQHDVEVDGSLSLNELEQGLTVDYVPMPDKLRDKYQSFTEADLTKLRAAGYQEAFMDVERGVGRYIKELMRPHVDESKK